MGVITRDKVKVLVRDTVTKIPEGQEFIVEGIELYRKGEEFNWFREGEDTNEWGRVGLPKSYMYIKTLGKGLRRKDLGELEELIYNKIIIKE